MRSVSTLLLQPASSRAALLSAIVAAAITFIALFPLTRASPFRVDEAPKISETVALRLLLEQRCSDPLWFGTLTDRSNPPFGKYYLGAAILLGGKELPRLGSLARVAGPDQIMPGHVSAEHGRPYVPLVVACRTGALVATCISVAIMAWLATRLYGFVAAAVATAFFVRHWMTAVFGASALFDSVQLCAIVLTAPLLLLLIQPRRQIVASLATGIACAAAFQTRLNGGAALAAVVIVLTVATLRTRSRWPAIAAAIVCATFLVAAVAMNPFYWADAPADPAVPPTLRADDSLVPRVVSRFRQQVADLATILHTFNADGVRMPLWAASSRERAPVPWTFRTKMHLIAVGFVDGFVDGVVVLLAIVGIIATIRNRTDARLALLAWSALIALALIVWLPLPWVRYLFSLLVPLGIYAGAGAAVLLNGGRVDGGPPAAGATGPRPRWLA